MTIDQRKAKGCNGIQPERSVDDTPSEFTVAPTLPWHTSTKPNRTARAPWLETTKKKIASKARTGERTERQQVGEHAERMAEQWLITQGLQPFARNVRFRSGEIDLIMVEGQTAVVVEVRFLARSLLHATALESVHGWKQAKVSKAARLWWAQLGQRHFKYLRFDVVAIEGDSPPVWIRNAWQICD